MLKDKLAKLMLVTGALAAISAFSVMAAGWTTNSSGEQVYVQDSGSVVTNSWIKASSNGQIIWYYATQDGTLRKNGWQTVNGKTYTATTNSKGLASVKVSLSSKKTYSFTAKFAGNDMYDSSSVKGKVTIK